MLALALCESSIGAHLQPYRPSSPSTARSSPPSLASFPSLQRAQKHSLGNSPRHVMWWPRYRYLNETLSTNCQRASSSDIDIGLRCLDNCIGQMALEPVKLSDSPPLMDKSPEDIGFTRGNYSSVSVNQNKVLLSNICKGLKFTILTGLLSSQGSQQAIADTEFARVQLMRYLGDLGDISTGFASAFLLIFFSELGDKTFFIAALLAARNSGAVVFIGTFGALAAMSVVSVILGRTFHYVDGILPFRFGEADFPIDDFAAVCLLIYFGVTTLLEAASDTELNIKEEQKEAELAISEVSGNGAGIMAAASTVISTFILVFVAEWGDKSFFSTIALAAASSPLGVICGALAGHALATLVAVVGGSLLGTFLSEKVIAYIGGVLFLVFAAVTLIEIVS